MSQELRITQDVMLDTIGIVFQNTGNGFGRTNRKGPLFYHNLARRGDLSNGTSTAFAIDNVLRSTGTLSAFFGRRIDSDKDHIGLVNSLVGVRRKEQVFAATFLNNFFESRFVNGQVIAVPSVNLIL